MLRVLHMLCMHSITCQITTLARAVHELMLLFLHFFCCLPNIFKTSATGGAPGNQNRRARHPPQHTGGAASSAQNLRGLRRTPPLGNIHILCTPAPLTRVLPQSENASRSAYAERFALHVAGMPRQAAGLFLLYSLAFGSNNRKVSLDPLSKRRWPQPAAVSLPPQRAAAPASAHNRCTYLLARRNAATHAININSLGRKGTRPAGYGGAACRTAQTRQTRWWFTSMALARTAFRTHDEPCTVRDAGAHMAWPYQDDRCVSSFCSVNEQLLLFGDGQGFCSAPKCTDGIPCKHHHPTVLAVLQPAHTLTEPSITRHRSLQPQSS